MYKILLVEDDEIIASSVCEYLKTWGYETEYVRDFEHIPSHSPRSSGIHTQIGRAHV